MKKSRLLAAVLAVATAASVTYAYAAGMFSNLPIVGSASYSAGLVTVPAGPTALTGTELIPADTGLAGGVAPQTVLITPAALNALPWAFETHPTTSSTTVISNNVGGLYVTTASRAAKAGMSIQMPSAPIDNQRVMVSADVAVTGIGFSANTGQTMDLAYLSYTISPLVATNGNYAGITFLYRLANTSWYRIQ